MERGVGLLNASGSPGVVHDSCVQSACDVVAKMKTSRPRFSGNVTICSSSVGPHHLTNAPRSPPLSRSAGTTARIRPRLPVKLRTLVAEQELRTTEWMPSAPISTSSSCVALVLEADADAFIGRLDGFDALVESNALERKSVCQCGHQVGAMDGQLRRAVLALGFVAHRQARGFLAGVPHAADAVVGRAPESRAALAITGPSPSSAPYRVGREIDVRADAKELPGLFEDGDVVARLMEGVRRRQAADAGTDDADFQWTHSSILSYARCDRDGPPANAAQVKRSMCQDRFPVRHRVWIGMP